MSSWIEMRNGGFLNPDTIEEIHWSKEAGCHRAISKEGGSIDIADPNTVIRQMLPCSEAYVCVDAYKQNGYWLFVETPIIGFGLTVTGEIRPVLISDLDIVTGNDWALRKVNGSRVWLPFEACYEDIEHWREALEARDAAEAEPAEDDKQEALL